MIRQPDFLQTDNHVRWSWGQGNQVWAMFAAAMAGDVSQVSSMLEADESLVRCSASYRTPLHFAVLYDRIEVVRLLLEKGAEVTYTGERGWHNSPVQLCRDRGYTELQTLLEQHQWANWQICTAGDEIADAFRKRDVGLTEKLISKHGIEVADARGNKPIHWAVMTRQVELIDKLLGAGTDINSQRPDGARPLDLTNGDYWYRGWRDLHPHAPKDHIAIMDHLLNCGAFYDLTTACRRNDRNRVLEILADDPDAATRDADYSTWYSGYPLRSAAKAGNIELVRLLLDHGADPNRAEHGLAPIGGCLYDAAQNGHYEVVKFLLESGADPDQEVDSSGCVLFAANDERTRSLLKGYGAVRDPFGCCYVGDAADFAIQCERDAHAANDASLFGMAAERGYKDVVDIFLKYQPDMWSRKPAAIGKTPEITDWMLASGMNINQTDWLGVHLLHRGCSAQVLEQFGQLGVDLNLIDDEHLTTPLGGAARRGDIEFVKLLLANGADPLVAGAAWARPVEWARRRNHLEIENLLIR
ncbi:MAG: ankyrin repeat domain-containing protein [Planctomycetota bacterium]